MAGFGIARFEGMGTMKRHYVVLTGLAALWLAAMQVPGPVRADDSESRRQHDPVTPIKHNDPQMLAAYAQAQRTLPEFLAVLDGKVPGAKYLAIKISFVDGPYTEHMWINNLSRDGDKFSGTVNDEPRVVENVEYGQQVAFSKSQIEDWHYTSEGKQHGNFTTCVLLSREDPEKARKVELRYGISCDGM